MNSNKNNISYILDMRCICSIMNERKHRKNSEKQDRLRYKIKKWLYSSCKEVSRRRVINSNNNKEIAWICRKFKTWELIIKVQNILPCEEILRNSYKRLIPLQSEMIMEVKKRNFYEAAYLQRYFENLDYYLVYLDEFHVNMRTQKLYNLIPRNSPFNSFH